MAPAWRDRHDFRRNRRDVITSAAQYSLRCHARCRHEVATRYRPQADRQDGTSAQPATFQLLAGRVVEGYAVLQPRVTPSLPVGRQGSVFQRIFSSVGGIDPYASAVSDVYQDLFGEGSYTGKGIYDIDAFEAALAGRVPDSTLLSHDLFEGVFARAGLASDVEVVEEFPLATTSGRYAITAGPVATGNSCRGFWGTDRMPQAWTKRGKPYRRLAAGRCSTISGAHCLRLWPFSPF